VSGAVLAMLALGAYIGLQDANQGSTLTPGAEQPVSQQGTTATVDEGGTVEGVHGGPGIEAPKNDFDGLMSAAEAAIQKRDWPVADAKGREALALAASYPAAQQRAQQVIDRATSESAYKLRYDALRDAATKKEYAKVKAELAAIDKKSTYHEDAQKEHDGARDSYLRALEVEAESLFDQGKCQAIRKLQTDANALWPESGCPAAARPARPARPAGDAAASAPASRRPSGRRRRARPAAGRTSPGPTNRSRSSWPRRRMQRSRASMAGPGGCASRRSRCSRASRVRSASAPLPRAAWETLVWPSVTTTSPRATNAE
jgi:hypothetical protein